MSFVRLISHINVILTAPFVILLYLGIQIYSIFIAICYFRGINTTTFGELNDITNDPSYTQIEKILILYRTRLIVAFALPVSWLDTQYIKIKLHYDILKEVVKKCLSDFKDSIVKFIFNKQKRNYPTHWSLTNQSIQVENLETLSFDVWYGHKERREKVRYSVIYRNKYEPYKKICTARPGWQRMSTKYSEHKKNMFQVPVSHLNKVLGFGKCSIDYYGFVDIDKNISSEERLVESENIWSVLEYNTSNYEQDKEVDTDILFVDVEPSLTVGELILILKERNLSFAVVPELEELTIGGIVTGAGIESSSHIFGLFQESVLALEVVCADGITRFCSRKQNSDLFVSWFWSQGTLGFLSAIRIRLIRSAPYIILRYDHLTLQIAEQTMEEEFTKIPGNRINNDIKLQKGSIGGVALNQNGVSRFIECLVLAENKCVVIRGDYYTYNKFLNDQQLQPSASSFAKYQNLKFVPLNDNECPWYWKHSARLESGTIEIVSTHEYYHRHTRGIFWEIDDIAPGISDMLKYIGFLLPLKVMFAKLSQPKQLQAKVGCKHVAQDYLIPQWELNNLIRPAQEIYSIFPMWVCPTKISYFLTSEGIKRGLVGPTVQRNCKNLRYQSETPFEIFFDLGIYGVPKLDKPSDPLAYIRKSRFFENLTVEKKGFQLLYGDCYMKEHEFNKMFNLKLYQSIKEETGADKVFPTLQIKCVEPYAMEMLNSLERATL